MDNEALTVAQGMCPICGCESVSYEVLQADEDGIFYPATCDECGATWHECYNIEFSGVDSVQSN